MRGKSIGRNCAKIRRGIVSLVRGVVLLVVLLCSMTLTLTHDAAAVNVGAGLEVRKRNSKQSHNRIYHPPPNLSESEECLSWFNVGRWPNTKTFTTKLL